MERKGENAECTLRARACRAGPRFRGSVATETEDACVQLTESDVCKSEFWHRCRVVLKDEGEERGLSQAWGRRRSGREGGRTRGGMSGSVSVTSTRTCRWSLPPRLPRSNPSTVDLKNNYAQVRLRVCNNPPQLHPSPVTVAVLE